MYRQLNNDSNQILYCTYLFIVDDEPLFGYLKTGDSMDLLGQRIADLPLARY